MLKKIIPLLFAFFAAISFAQVNKDLPVVDIKIQGHALKAELVKDNETRSIGLMNRFSLKPDHGMLFIFKEPAMIGMWMKNTYVPLSVAFIDEKGVILNIENMKPQSLDTHSTVAPALYALEMKLGWFDAKGIKAGAKLEGLAKLGKATN
jgi:uncharacterized protein